MFGTGAGQKYDASEVATEPTTTIGMAPTTSVLLNWAETELGLILYSRIPLTQSENGAPLTQLSM